MTDPITLQQLLDAAGESAGEALRDVSALRQANAPQSELDETLQRSELAQWERNRVLREMGRLPGRH